MLVILKNSNDTFSIDMYIMPFVFDLYLDAWSQVFLGPR